MATVQKSIRIQKVTAGAIEALALQSGKDFSIVANELLEEAVKMKRCPGIIFTEGTAGRRARIAGTGLEVWEIIAAYRSVDKNLDRLRTAYHWLTSQQIMAAIGYYRLYPVEIDNQIMQNEALTVETLNETYPFIQGNHR